MNLAKEAAIVGVGTATPGKQPKTNMRLHLEAARAAIVDAGLSTRDIDGIISGDTGGYSPRIHIEIAESLGIHCAVLACNLPSGGGSTLAMSIAAARWAVVSGVCRHVLLVSAHTDSNLYAEAEPPPVAEHRLDRHFGSSVDIYRGALAQRYVYESRVSPEALARVAVAFRGNAARNPEARYRDALTVADVLASPIVASPLHVLECARPTDGGAAFVMTSTERARDLRGEVVAILGYGHAAVPYFLPVRASGGSSRQTPTPLRRAAEDAFAEAGVKPNDVSFAQLHDLNTAVVLMQLEELGLCADGEAKKFFADTGTPHQLSLNTDGGSLSHACGPSGFSQVIETVRQLRGEGGSRQVEAASMGLFACTSSTLSSSGVGVLAKV
jgi:acetyl-CoA acetyltransferase